MQRLKVPDALAGPGVERDRAVREQVVAAAIAAVEVEGRRAESGEDQPALLVDAEPTPGVGPAPVLPGIALPGLVSELSRTGHGVEPPEFLARADVERPDVPRRGDAGPFSAGDADDDGVLPEGRGGRRSIAQRRDLGIEVLAEIEDTAVGEFRVETAGLRVE